MKEGVLRKYHRYLGISLVIFLFLQGGSGLLISVGELIRPTAQLAAANNYDHSQGNQASHDDEGAGDSHDIQGHVRHNLLGRFHHSKGAIWNVYRLGVGSGLMVMLFTGTVIFIKTQSRLNLSDRNTARTGGSDGS